MAQQLTTFPPAMIEKPPVPAHEQQHSEYSQHQSPPHVPQQPEAAHTYTSPQAMNQQPPVHDHGLQHQEKIVDQGVSEWKFGFFDCFKPLDTCCIGFWCPCYLFGKTYQRNRTGEKDPSGFNGMCCAWYATALCGCAPILQCVQRMNYREKHGIEGSSVGDFCASWCCMCCALVQEEKESVVRATGMDPTTKTAYQSVPQMTYP